MISGLTKQQEIRLSKIEKSGCKHSIVEVLRQLGQKAELGNIEFEPNIQFAKCEVEVDERSDFDCSPAFSVTAVSAIAEAAKKIAALGFKVNVSIGPSAVICVKQ